MRLCYINPNSTEAMTDSIVAAARAAAPEHEIAGLTNRAGPPAIQGAEDGAAAVPGLMALLPAARGADAIVIACFDDTGLAEMRAAAPCPVLGIGQSAYVTAALLGHRFSVVTTLAVSVPVLRANIEGLGLAGQCAAIRPTGLPVLEVEAGGDAVISRVADEIARAEAEDGVGAVVLGCAGMAALRAALQARSRLRVIDGVAASARLAAALAERR